MKLQILKYELKKIFCKKSSIISLVVLGICMGFMLFSCLSEISYSDAKGNHINGIKAVRLLRNEKMQWNGIISSETVRKVITKNSAINSYSQYKGMKESDIKLSNMQYSRKQGFMDIRELINLSYGEVHSYDYYLIDRLSPDVANTFYTNRVGQIKTLATSQEADYLTKNEKNYLIDSAKTLSTPFNYSYADGWLNALERSATVLFALAFVICILLAPVFSVEYQTCCDAILLSTEHGKRKGILYKLIAGLLSASLVYWITAGVVYCLMFTVFGIEGGDCPIQASFSGWKSFYHVTNIQSFWMVLILGYVGCMFIGSLTMFLSSKVKTSFATIILIFIFIMVPATIGKSLVTESVWNKIIDILPHQMLLGWTIFRTYILYDIGGKVVTPYEVLPVLYGILAVILLPFAYNSFRKHKIA